MPLPVVSLYSGAGGLESGLSAAGSDVRVCVELDADCVATLWANHPRWAILRADVAEVPGHVLCEIARIPHGHPWVLVAGPPCQPFSKSAHWTTTPRGTCDLRASALHQFLRLLKEAKPSVFLLENVPELASKVHGETLRMILDRMADLGYSVKSAILNAADYGVPQTRQWLL